VALSAISADGAGGLGNALLESPDGTPLMLLEAEG